MKRWAVLVAILYALLLGILAVPGAWLAFAPKIGLTGALGVYGRWLGWFLLGVMALGQIVFLSVPVRVVSRRPMTRRPLAQTVFAAALMTAALVIGAFCSIYEFALHEMGGSWVIWTGIALGVGAWIAWAVIFFRMSRVMEPDDLISRLCKYMLKGSILELMIAVPTHIVARCRDYCCAGIMTFIGLTLGISVMLFSFGPGVFFLFAARWRRVRPGEKD